MSSIDTTTLLNISQQASDCEHCVDNPAAGVPQADNKYSANDEDVCWVCLEPSTDDVNNMVCDCVGQLRVVHGKCLQKWADVSENCRVCQQPYRCATIDHSKPKSSAVNEKAGKRQRSKSKEAALLGAQVAFGVFTIAAPYVAGPIIMAFEKEFKELDWL